MNIATSHTRHCDIAYRVTKSQRDVNVALPRLTMFMGYDFFLLNLLHNSLKITSIFSSRAVETDAM